MVLKRKLPDLDQDPFKPLYAQLAEAIIKFIRKYRLGEGDWAPSENELLARYKISRTTIRQAFQYLESLGGSSGNGAREPLSPFQNIGIMFRAFSISKIDSNNWMYRAAAF